MAYIKKKSERKFKITVCNGYKVNGQKRMKAQTITVPSSVPKRGIQQYVMAEAERIEKKFKYGVEESDQTHFDQYAENWLKRQEPFFKATTYAGYKRNLDIVYPLIGGIPLAKLLPMTLEEMCKELRKRPGRGGNCIKETTVQKYLETVSSVLEDAKENDIIPFNPAHRVRKKHFEKEVQHIPQKYEMSKLMRAIQNEPILYAVQFISNMGSTESFQTLSENIPYHTRCILVNFQTLMLVASFYITVNSKSSNKITAASFHIQGTPGLYGNIPAVCLVHNVFYRYGEIICSVIFRVYIVIDGDKTDAVGRKYPTHITARLYVLTPQAGKVFLCQVGTKKILRIYKPFIGGQPPVNGLRFLYALLPFFVRRFLYAASNASIIGVTGSSLSCLDRYSNRMPLSRNFRSNLMKEEVSRLIREVSRVRIVPMS